MTDIPHAIVPDHLLELDEWDALDHHEVYRRAELVEGVLVMAPQPLGTHQRLGAWLSVTLEAQLGLAYRVAPDVELLIDAGPPPTVRQPDVAVIRTRRFEGRYRYDPADVLAVFEILSPGTRRTDRVAKLAEYAEYAEAGIPHYGIVDPGPPVTLTEFGLAEGRYEHVAEHHGSAALAFDVTLDLDALR